MSSRRPPRRDSRLTDEAPGAYRDIGAVMDAQRDLVDVQHRLNRRPQLQRPLTRTPRSEVVRAPS